jgi:hypothetical protein
MHTIISRCYLAAILIGGMLSGGELQAKKKTAKPDAAPQDAIAIEAHIPASAGPVARFTVTQHYSRTYVYAERGPGQPVTLIDATQPSKPQVLSDLQGSASGSLVAVAGTAALSSDAAPAAIPAPQTIRIMDFSDPASPRVTRQFDGVTAIGKSGSLIFLANPEGIWILSEHLALDPAVEAEYARRVVYGP